MGEGEKRKAIRKASSRSRRPMAAPAGLGDANGDADTGSARSVNGSAAGMSRSRRKSFLPNDLLLTGRDFASVRRSATLPNEVLQKRGCGKAGGQRSEARGQRSEVRGQGADAGGQGPEVRNMQSRSMKSSPASSGN